MEHLVTVFRVAGQMGGNRACRCRVDLQTNHRAGNVLNRLVSLLCLGLRQIAVTGSQFAYQDFLALAQDFQRIVGCAKGLQ